MHILITGAAGMIGRKLTARLIADGGLNGKPIDRLTLLDIVTPEIPTGCRNCRSRQSPPIWPRRASRRNRSRSGPEMIFHLAGVVSGEAETDFDKGYRVNLDGTQALLEAIRLAGDGYVPKVVFTSSIAVYGAPFPDDHPRRFPPDAADLLRHAEGDRSNCCSPTIRGAASSTASASGCRRSACGRASPTRRRPASSPASSASRSPARRRCCRSPRTCAHWHASPRAAIGFLCTPPG